MENQWCVVSTESALPSVAGTPSAQLLSPVQSSTRVLFNSLHPAQQLLLVLLPNSSLHPQHKPPPFLRYLAPLSYFLTTLTSQDYLLLLYHISGIEGCLPTPNSSSILYFWPNTLFTRIHRPLLTSR